MGRSAESQAREAIRARSVRKFSGRDPARIKTGHPAFCSVAPAYELERIPEGGGYPVGFVDWAARLMGCADVGAVVHMCSGGIRSARTFDLRAESSCAVVADCRRLPVRSGSVRWVMIDPPYGQDYAEELWGLGKQYPTPTVLLREAARILVDGGRVAFLHHLVPAMPPDLVRMATFGVTTGVGFRIRALTIAERRSRDGVTDRVCPAPGCKRHVGSGRWDKVYCSDACRQRAHRARRGDQPTGAVCGAPAASEGVSAGESR